MATLNSIGLIEVASVATGYLDRALLSAVSIVPVQLLAWQLAQTRGRTPGQYMRASKVTTRE